MLNDNLRTAGIQPDLNALCNVRPGFSRLVNTDPARDICYGYSLHIRDVCARHGLGNRLFRLIGKL